MWSSDWTAALIGGAMIGGACGLLLLSDGRIFGVSGIYGSILPPKGRDDLWRVATVLGLILGGMILKLAGIPAFEPAYPHPLWVAAAAGVLVGFGTRLGSGCTSGHGVCGIGRLSKRSLVATAVFLGVGVLTATSLHFLGGDLP